MVENLRLRQHFLDFLRELLSPPIAFIDKSNFEEHEQTSQDVLELLENSKTTM